jgi:hypothetical protein
MHRWDHHELVGTWTNPAQAEAEGAKVSCGASPSHCERFRPPGATFICSGRKTPAPCGPTSRLVRVSPWWSSTAWWWTSGITPSGGGNRPSISSKPCSDPDGRGGDGTGPRPPEGPDAPPALPRRCGAHRRLGPLPLPGQSGEGPDVECSSPTRRTPSPTDQWTEDDTCGPGRTSSTSST